MRYRRPQASKCAELLGWSSQVIDGDRIRGKLNRTAYRLALGHEIGFRRTVVSPPEPDGVLTYTFHCTRQNHFL